ncbi:GDNF family receptor alpha-2 [Rhinatrema bivittatum]|uniref:GDNF family receptor alpha-2 n=1 Tax=Rhinatrema bivittatum TaxID=194408 RepID=UPI00112E2C1E|nr:GDNF family receptor alpha-2 [Rhinatrema bivittatum]
MDVGIMSKFSPREEESPIILAVINKKAEEQLQTSVHPFNLPIALRVKGRREVQVDSKLLAEPLPIFRRKLGTPVRRNVKGKAMQTENTLEDLTNVFTLLPPGIQTSVFFLHICYRARLADFHTNCQVSFLSVTSCPLDNYRACLDSYAGLIGFDMTPNYVDSSTSSIVISPWCSCKGSGNMEEECEKFVRDFTENSCLRNAIQAFGNGTDVNILPKTHQPLATVPARKEKSSVSPDDVNDSSSAYDSIITTCASVQENGPKLNKSKEQNQNLCYLETQLTTDIMHDQRSYVDEKSFSFRHCSPWLLPVIPFLTLELAL